MDKYAHDVYAITKNFPKDELYGVTSQLRRAALSVVLNYIEGYSRKKKLVMINFFEIFLFLSIARLFVIIRSQVSGSLSSEL